MASKNKIVDPNDREQFVWTLVSAEILARRKELGPLARLWVPRGPARTRKAQLVGSVPERSVLEE